MRESAPSDASGSTLDPARAVRDLFLKEGKVLPIGAGERLMLQGEPNHRLYYVFSGLFQGSTPDSSGVLQEVVRFSEGDLIGVQSFFGTSGTSALTVTALENGEVRHILREHFPSLKKNSLEGLLLPYVVEELVRRQRLMHQMAREDAELREKLSEVERLSSLGQLAAGVAHELNNAIAVISRGAEWMEKKLDWLIGSRSEMKKVIFQSAVNRHSALSTRELHQRTKEFQEKYRLSYNEAKKLAHLNLDEHSMRLALRDSTISLEDMVNIWDIGATLRNFVISSNHAKHVVASIQDLGAPRSHVLEPVDLRDTLHSALTILQNVTKGIQIELQIPELPPIEGNKGQLVQIWTNIIKNACEAIQGDEAALAEPLVRVSAKQNRQGIEVEVFNTGPRIPANILSQIFQPHFTTKKKGLTFGLGLGLSIVTRLIREELGGDVSVQNREDGVAFRVLLPHSRQGA